MSFYLAIGAPIVIGGVLRLFRARGNDPGSLRRRVAIWIILSAAAWAWAAYLGGRTFWLQGGVLFQTLLFVEVMVAEVVWAAAAGAFASARSSLRRMRATRTREREKSAPCD